MNLVRGYVKNHSQDLQVKPLWEFIYDNGKWPFDKGASDSTRLIKVFQQLLREAQLNSTQFNERHLVRFLENSKDWRVYLIDVLVFNCNKKNLKLLSEFINLERRFFRLEENDSNRTINLKLEGYLSSGENSLLTLYSRLYSSLTDYSVPEDGGFTKTSLTIMLDEPEIAFHPEWKRFLIRNLSTFLNKLPFEFQYQLVLVSHSPFIVSDLPKENVVHINKVDDVIRVENSKDKKTFGANILRLFSDSFYLDNGFIGEFAKQTLENLIISLKNPLDTTFSMEQAKEIINEVGDELISLKLTELFMDKYEAVGEDLQKDIADLEARLNELKKKLNHDKN